MKRYMKKITKYCSSLFVCVLLLSQTSCDSFLDRQEDEALTLDKVWETRADSRKYWLTTMSFYRMTLMISNILRGAGQLMK